MAGKKGDTSFKAKAKAGAKARASAKSRDKRRSKQQAARQADIVAAPKAEQEEEEMEMDDDDLAFVQKNAKGLSFLNALNPEKLTKVTKEQKSKRIGKPAQHAVAAPGELSESDDESGDESNESDEDLEVLESSEDEAEDELVDFVVSDSEQSGAESFEDESEAESLGSEDEEEYLNHKQRKALKRKAAAADLMDYEHGMRKFESADKKIKESSKLPIKLADGRLVAAEESEEEDVGEEEEEEEEEEPVPKPTKGLGGRPMDSEGEADFNEEPDRGSMTRREYIVAQQNRLAGLASAVVQSPEGSARALRLLHKISEDSDRKVRQLGLLTQLAVYRDILPDYRIRELTEKERAMKVTKEVRQQRMFEESLVKTYGQYLHQLFAAVKRGMKIFGDASADVETGVVAARALGELVNAHPHFNFRKDILSALVDIYVQPSSRITMPEFAPMAQTARLAVLRLFHDDASGEYSQNAVVLAAKRIKRLSYRVDASSLRPWLHLRLRDELRENPEDRKRAEVERLRKEQLRERNKLMKRKKSGSAVGEARRAAFETKKQKKARRVQQEVDRDLRDAQAEVTREERERWFGETLKQVFVTYFRILKQKDNIGGLLPAVLEGLAKYAHLISVEFFLDLFHLLKKIMRGQHGVGVGNEDDDTSDLVSFKVSLRTSLLCILSALHILTGQGEALNLDIKDFFHQLYALLPPLAAHAQIEATRLSSLSDGTRFTVYLAPAEVAQANAERVARQEDTEQPQQLEEAMWEATVRSEADLLFECLELMFLGRTKVSSVTRVAAFVKRLAEGALYWPPKTAVRAIAFIHKLMVKYPHLDRLFASDEQAASGLYLKDIDDPDMCNPFGSCVYEIHCLQTHHNATVRAAAARLLAFVKAEDKKHQL
ncbi:hypothetical protein EC988_003965 [Linderina pennispora]|nr:hypothetical protein EC988_003965 [Linderina pennispora]